jgi:hypothetical protein
VTNTTRLVIGTILVCSRITAASPQEDAVLAAYKLIEKAVRNGDGDLWLRLQDRKTLTEMGADGQEKMRRGVRARPSIRYNPVAVRVKNDEAVVIGRALDQYHTILFRLENGTWKIDQEKWSNVPIDSAVLFAILPPDPGAFARAGSPWQNVPYASRNSKYFKPEEVLWKLQATYDESFLYIRIEAERQFPAHGTEIAADAAKRIDTGAPRGWPVMEIVTKAPPAEFRFRITDVISSWSTFDSSGKANSIRYFVAYSFIVDRQGDQNLFDNNTGDPSSRLLAVHEQFIDMKIPLKVLGVDGVVRPGIEIADANSANKFLPYQVSRFSR